MEQQELFPEYAMTGAAGQVEKQLQELKASVDGLASSIAAISESIKGGAEAPTKDEAKAYAELFSDEAVKRIEKRVPKMRMPELQCSAASLLRFEAANDRLRAMADVLNEDVATAVSSMTKCVADSTASLNSSAAAAVASINQNLAPRLTALDRYRRWLKAAVVGFLLFFVLCIGLWTALLVKCSDLDAVRREAVERNNAAWQKRLAEQGAAAQSEYKTGVHNGK